MPFKNPSSLEPPRTLDEASLQARILSILDSQHLMALATNRPDGWPQVTLVNYFRREHALYFVVAADSQKFANISQDPRVSIAINGEAVGPYSLSMAAHVTTVDDSEQIEGLNKTIQARTPDAAFVPHPSASSVVLLQAQPQIMTVVDYTTPPGRRETLVVVENWTMRREGDDRA